MAFGFSLNPQDAPLAADKRHRSQKSSHFLVCHPSAAVGLRPSRQASSCSRVSVAPCHGGEAARPVESRPQRTVDQSAVSPSPARGGARSRAGHPPPDLQGQVLVGLPLVQVQALQGLQLDEGLRARAEGPVGCSADGEQRVDLHRRDDVLILTQPSYSCLWASRKKWYASAPRHAWSTMRSSDEVASSSSSPASADVA
ncbi:hypothetical protein EYF80_037744 [Liparis tanakae]|uniref:Uncharacterized protein n=1 Tax=Liparis tanakae TaxID=230148 RepID=A0A4Z2GF61_9TELE|nr:hypothetical protein EYF80_037744 [Liparis tanakae]